MKYRIFISSVQREFAKERKALASYIRKDAILGKFFEVFLFEEVPAQERKADGVYLAEVDDCDIYLGIFGHTYGNVDSRGVSATEREYRRAAAKHKYRICFVAKSAGETDQREAAFISRVNDDVVRKGFVGYDDLRTAVYAALAMHLEDKGLINVLPFDAAKTAGVELKHLNFSKMRAFVRDAREKRGFKLPLNAKPMDVLTALDLVDDKGQIANSAALLFGKRPQHFFRPSEVKCAWFLTYKVAKPIADFKVFEGDVFELADQARDFVMSHLSRRIGEHFHGAAETTYDLPERAVFEAIVNAICHRDYNSNSSVQVMLFPDRLEVSSPGPLPTGMTVAMLKRRHRSIPVNPLLAQGMYLRGYIEHVGSGTGDIIEKCRESGLPPPQWESEVDGLTIILRRANIVSRPQTDRGGVNASQTAPKHHRDAFDDALELRLLDALRKDASSDQVELSKILGVSRATVQRCFKRLLKAGKVGRIGGKRFGHWEVLA